MLEIIKDLTIVIGVPLLRGVAGWVEKYARDGVVDALDWKRLVETILRISVPGLALYYGLDLLIEMSATIPLLVDYGYHYINKIRQK